MVLAINGFWFIMRLHELWLVIRACGLWFVMRSMAGQQVLAKIAVGNHLTIMIRPIRWDKGKGNAQ